MEGVSRGQRRIGCLRRIVVGAVTDVVCGGRGLAGRVLVDRILFRNAERNVPG